MPLSHTQAYEIVVGGVLVTIATIAVTLRIYAKLTKKNGVGVDDWLAIVGLVFVFGMLTELLLWVIVGGNGIHVADTTVAERLNFFKMFYTNELTYILTTPCIKLSILVLYYHIFFSRPFRLAVQVVGLFTILFAIAFFFAAAFQCQPIEAGWNKALQGKCFNSQTYIEAFASFNIVLDVSILVLPIPMVWTLQREWQYKLALTGVFVLGGFVCGASIYRLVTILLIDANDITYTIYKATVWTFVEPCIGLLCACLPIIWGLFPSFDSIRSRSRSRKARKTSGYERNSYILQDSNRGYGYEATARGAMNKDQWVQFDRESDEHGLVEHDHGTGGSKTKHSVAVSTRQEEP